MNRQRSNIIGVVIAACAAALLMLPSTAFAQGDYESSGQIGQGKNVGIGLGGGSIVSGLTLKGYFSDKLAGQLFLGGAGAWGYGGFGFGIDGDIVYEFATIAEADGVGRLFLGAGGGAGFIANPFFSAGSVNALFEMGWHFTEVPIELVIDYRPTFYFGGFNTLRFAGPGGFIPWGFSGAFRFYF
jgi:hypothetical protein